MDAQVTGAIFAIVLGHLRLGQAETLQAVVVAGTFFPAVLRQPGLRGGAGRHVDIAIADGLMAHAVIPNVAVHSQGQARPVGQDKLTGALPCYNYYRTADGRWLAYISRVGGAFKLHVMDLSSGTVNAVTDTTADENPSFAPNSRLIVYATQQQGREALMTTTLDGKIKARLAGQAGDIREPDWGPFQKQ